MSISTDKSFISQTRPGICGFWPRLVLLTGLLLGSFSVAAEEQAGLKRSLTYGELISEVAHAERTAKRQEELGITRIPAGGGTYIFGLPADLETPELIIEGALTLRYDGQQVFPETVEPAEPTWIFDVPEPPRVLIDELLGTVKVDEYGRRWVVAEINYTGLDATLADYDSQVVAAVGPEDEPVLESRPDTRLDSSGELGFYEPDAWNLTDCNADSENDIRTWGNEDRQISANPMSARQKKVLLLRSSVGLCSGTMVDGRWLLTAAHCVTDDNGNEVHPSTIDACTLGNYQNGAQCYGAAAITVAPGYTGSGDMSDDYAVVKLSGSPNVGYMYISAASNEIIKSHPGYKIGYPGWRPGCVANSAPQINPGLPAAYQYFSSGDVFKMGSKRIKTTLDAGPGESGGPYFYYPDGCCGRHYLTGVHSGYVTVNPGKNYHGGPKGPAIRSWVIANTP